MAVNTNTDSLYNSYLSEINKSKQKAQSTNSQMQNFATEGYSNLNNNVAGQKEGAQNFLQTGYSNALQGAAQDRANIQDAYGGLIDYARTANQNKLSGLNTERQNAANQYTQMGQTAQDLYGNLLTGMQGSYNNMLNKSEESYAERLRNAVAANNAAANQQIARLNSQRYDIEDAYKDNARQAYTAYMQGRNAMPQLLAASGLTGGASETANLGLLTNYNSNLGNINNERTKAIRSIDDSILQAMYQAELDNAQAGFTNSGEALNSYLGIMNDSINNYNNAYGNYANTLLGIQGDRIAADTAWANAYQNAYNDYINQTLGLGQNAIGADMDYSNQLQNIYGNYLNSGLNTDYQYNQMQNSGYSDYLNTLLGLGADSADQDYKFASLYGNALDSMAKIALTRAEMENDQANLEWQRQYQEAQDEYDRLMDLRSMAQWKLANGISLSDEEQEAMNMSASDIANLAYSMAVSGGGSSGGSSGGGGSRRSSGRSYSRSGSSGSSGGTASGNIGDYVIGSADWNKAVAAIAAEAGITPQQYIGYYYTDLGIRNQNAAAEAIESFTAWQKANQPSSGSDLNSKNSLNALSWGLAANPGADQASAASIVNNLYQQGSISDSSASTLLDRIKKWASK